MSDGRRNFTGALNSRNMLTRNQRSFISVIAAWAGCYVPKRAVTLQPVSSFLNHSFLFNHRTLYIHYAAYIHYFILVSFQASRSFFYNLLLKHTEDFSERRFHFRISRKILAKQFLNFSIFPNVSLNQTLSLSKNLFLQLKDIERRSRSPFDLK